MTYFQCEFEHSERMRLEQAVKTGSLPDDAKMGVTSLGASLTSSILTPASSSVPGEYKNSCFLPYRMLCLYPSPCIWLVQVMISCKLYLVQNLG